VSEADVLLAVNRLLERVGIRPVREGVRPERRDDDPEGVRALFDLIEQQEKIIAKASEMIITIRQREVKP
jgi:hypothetical protein